MVMRKVIGYEKVVLRPIVVMYYSLAQQHSSFANRHEKCPCGLPKVMCYSLGGQYSHLA